MKKTLTLLLIGTTLTSFVPPMVYGSDTNTIESTTSKELIMNGETHDSDDEKSHVLREGQAEKAESQASTEKNYQSSAIETVTTEQLISEIIMSSEIVKESETEKSAESHDNTKQKEVSETDSDFETKQKEDKNESGEKKENSSFDKPSYSSISLDARLKDGNINAWSQPYNYPGYKNIGKANAVAEVGNDYHIKRQAKTKNGIYYEVAKNIWVGRSAFEQLDKPAYTTINSDARLKDGNINAWSEPYHYFGYKNIGKANAVAEVGNDYHIKRQAKTKNGIYYEVAKNVWIGRGAFEQLDKPTYTTINIDARLKDGNINAWSQPYNYPGYKNIGKANAVAEVGNDYHIKRQAKTKNGIYYEVAKNIWVGRSAFEQLDKPAYTTINSDARLKDGNINAWSEPYHYFGYKNIGKAKAHLKVGKTYKIKRQAKTKNGIYYEVAKNIWVGRSAFDSNAEKMKKVQKLLNDKYRSGNYGIYVKSLTSGETATIRENQVFHAASTGKLPAIYYTQKMINEGKINKNALFENKPAINNMVMSYSPWGAGILQGQPWGSYHTIDKILNWTIKYSDNQGANFLAYYAAGRYSPKMKKEIKSIIGREWNSPFSATAKENGKLMEAINKQGGNAVKYLQNTTYDKERIPKYLPVKVGHKIGDLEGYTHDVAIVYGREPYILSVMTKNYMGKEKIAIMSKDIYNILK